GPVLIVTPYSVARALANRAALLRTKRAVHATLLLLIVALLMAGCSMGPRTVVRDRFDYSAAVADSWKSQMMLNLVRLRYGDIGGDLRARPAEAEFLELLERLRRVQLSGAIGMRVQRTDTKEVATLLTFRQKVEPGVAADALGIRKLLGIDPAATEFRVVYGAIAADAREIAMLTRSALEI